jgi:hypothetical protein
MISSIQRGWKIVCCIQHGWNHDFFHPERMAKWFAASKLTLAAVSVCYGYPSGIPVAYQWHTSGIPVANPVANPFSIEFAGLSDKSPFFKILNVLN